MAVAEDREATLNAWAWDRFDELADSGVLTLRKGVVLVPGRPGFEEILGWLKWLASRKASRPARRVAEPSDFVPKETRREKDKDAAPLPA